MGSEPPIVLRNVPPVQRARIRATPCCICRRARKPQDAYRGLTCGRKACLRAYGHLHARRRREGVALPLAPKSLPTCSVCGWALTPLELDRSGMWAHVTRDRGVCADGACRAEWRERRRTERDAALRDAQRLTAKLDRHRDDAAAEHGIDAPERYEVVRIPYNSRRMVNLGERRRRRFRDFLYQLIARAVQPVEGEPEPEPSEVPPAALPGVIRACTLCRGNCCFDGADHAHLRVADIRRHMQRHPDQRPRDVHAAFMARIGRRVYEDSCLYHGSRGCELGELRGLTCRRHFCDGLLAYQRGVREGETERACFVSLGPGVAAHYVPGQTTSSETPVAGVAFDATVREDDVQESTE